MTNRLLVYGVIVPFWAIIVESIFGVAKQAVFNGGTTHSPADALLLLPFAHGAVALLDVFYVRFRKREGDPS